MKLHTQYKRRLRHYLAAAPVSYLPTDVARIYQFPVGVDASKQGVGILSLGGAATVADQRQAFMAMNRTAPPLSFVSVGGAQMVSDGPDGADGENALDIQISQGVSGAPAYFFTAENSDAGILGGLAQMRTDPRVTVGSLSWGGTESSYSPSSRTAINGELALWAAAGKVLCVAAGDNGSSDGGKGVNVDFPASSPYALAVGGTSLQPNGAEAVWNDDPTSSATGGGFSQFFAAQAWQLALGIVKWRGVPDVAGNADPNTPWHILCDGQWIDVGGTSCSAPMWAGLIALLQAALGNRPLGGTIIPFLYGNPSGLNDIVVGNNGNWKAAPGWDPCTGLGSPNGTRLLSLLGGPPTTPPPPTTPTPPTPVASFTIPAAGTYNVVLAA